MSHFINAIIGNRNTLANLIERLGLPGPVEIPFDLFLIALDEQRLDAIAISTEPSFDGFSYLTPKMAMEIGRWLDEGSALYIETEYFGGTGGQGAALFENGALIWKRAETTLGPDERPTRPAKTPISEGLARLGVVAFVGADEFDSVGLGNFRSLSTLGLGGY